MTQATPPRTPRRLLIANRGEIAIRIARAATELGIEPVCIYATDDASALHRYAGVEALALDTDGPRAYLDAKRIVSLARVSGCEAIHPGYGFLSESASFAAACDEAGLNFIGPDATTIALLGDKARARELARSLKVPVAPGTHGATSLQEVLAFFDALGPGAEVMIKALAGGGGRGMRAVTQREALPAAYERCRSEAQGAFGNADLYVEQRLCDVRHIEVQVAGDGRGGVWWVGDRDCSIQRRHQKIVEFAPAPFLSSDLRDRLREAALRMAGELRYRALGTFEFLVSLQGGDFHFMEANPRLQVEHTVTEEVYGIDLVRAQILLGCGASAAECGLESLPAPRGFAVQLRVNLESLDAHGGARPARGTLEVFDVPGGPGVRVDTCGYAGLTPSQAFDPLIAKLIVHHPSSDLRDLITRARRALSDFGLKGMDHNLDLLDAVLAEPSLASGPVSTGFFEAALPRLLGHTLPRRSAPPRACEARTDVPAATRRDTPLAQGMQALRAPMAGKLLAVPVAPGDLVGPDTLVAVLESMKMEHEVRAGVSGCIRRVLCEVGAQLDEGDALFELEPMETQMVDSREGAAIDLDHIRPDLAQAYERHAWQRDDQRAEAVADRHGKGKRTARENIADLLDPGSFLEYGPLMVAGQRGRRSIEELRRISPADGLVTGTGSINADAFGVEAARCMVMAYDYTVLAGTQGFLSHRKADRMLELAERLRCPLVLFAEGGGGRPGDTDNIGGANPSNPTFWRFARLSALVPLIGVVSGRCFAGNAVLLGACDVIIATRDASIGMGGPVMIECGGLGKYTPDEVGPVSFQAPNGVVDIVVEDEAQAVQVARSYLSYFQGRLAHWECADQRELRHVVPENRLRAYDVRRVITLLADTGSVLELRQAFGPGIVTSLVRIEGRTVGVMANNPQHLAGAIDADESDKAARFMQLCDAFDIPILSLVDTPGFMVGPLAERHALVRHTARMFVTAASLKVPMCVVVLRKGYGLGAMAIGGGAFQRAAVSAVSWPTGEFGAMGLEGAVRLAYRSELAAIADEDARQARYEELVDRMYQHGKAVNIAPFFAFDDVIDPAETRHWLVRSLQALPPQAPRTDKRRPNIDPW